MAGQLTIDTLKASSGVLATQNGMTGIAKAWVNFNGVTTATIRSSFNVSSVTRNGTGDYTVNFTTVMPDANYSACATATQRGGSGGAATNMSVGFGGVGTSSVAGTYSTSAVQVYSQYSNGTAVDANVVCISIFSA